MRRSWPILTALILVGGCAPYELEDLRQPAVEIPMGFQSPTPAVEAPEHWWLAFGDPGLNQTVAEFLECLVFFFPLSIPSNENIHSIRI